MWLGASSRVALPVVKTPESLSNVYLPSGFGIALVAVGQQQRLRRRRGASPSGRPGSRPLVTTIALVIAPPTIRPRANGCFMLRDS